MGKIVSLVNPKGGTCKSTLALCLGSLFEDSCIIDLDPQGSIWNWQQERWSGPYGRVEPIVGFYGVDGLTAEALDKVAGDYRTVFIDCPGESEAGDRTKTAMVYSDLVIIPVKESEFDAASLIDHLIPLIEDAKASNERGGNIVLLPTMYHVNAKAERIIEKIRALELDVLPAVFRERNVYKKFAENGQTLQEYSDNARFVKDRIQARAAIGDLLEIVVQMTNYLG